MFKKNVRLEAREGRSQSLGFITDDGVVLFNDANIATYTCYCNLILFYLAIASYKNVFTLYNKPVLTTITKT